jgi:hypothetical protein
VIRLIVVPVLCAAIGLGATLGTATGDTGVSARTLIVRPGDQIRVQGAPIACRVTRVRELGRRIALDCRRGGALAGTYGTLLTAREAAVVAFANTRTAKVVSIATHGGEVRTQLRNR